jgi:adenylate cyclase
MLDKVEVWNGERQAAGEPPVRLSVGVHAGPVVLGDIGTERRMEFAVIGDTVNIASRLQELTRQHDARLAASGDLVAALDENDRAALAGDLRQIGATQLRGRREATDIWILA